MESEDLSEYSFYKDLSELFVGLGSLLIDADAFIGYALDERQDQIPSLDNIKDQVNTTVKKLKNCGFKDVQIVFFKRFFTKSEWYSDKDLQFIFSNHTFNKFEDTDHVDWKGFVRDQQIAIMLTETRLTEIKESEENYLQNEYIETIVKDYEIPIALFQSIEFKSSGSKVFAFIVQGGNFRKRQLARQKRCPVERSPSYKAECNFKMHKIENRKIAGIFGETVENDPLSDSNTMTARVDDDDLPWDEKDFVSVETPKKAVDDNPFKVNCSASNQPGDSLADLTTSTLWDIRIEDEDKEEELKKKADEKRKNTKLLKKRIKERKNRKNDDEDDDDKYETYDVTRKEDKPVEGCEKRKTKDLNYENNTYYRYLQKYAKSLDRSKEQHHKIIFDTQRKPIHKENVHQRANDAGKEARKPRIVFFGESPEQFDDKVYSLFRNEGDKLERTLNTRPDQRVRFEPDEWQIDLLNIVDNDESALVCCPTGAGKTFICYYAMERILRSDNYNDMIVYVAPTKALANQVTAEVYARFDRKYPENISKTVFAMLMENYTIRNPFDCQILITLPNVFESVLLNSANKKWTSRIKYLIIDEVQTINDHEMGASIERIIHFISCPIIALSATISNLDEFFEWFQAVEIFKEKPQLHKIAQYERYCDLQKFMFVPKAVDDTISSEGLLPIHELFGYPIEYLRTHSFAQDFHFLPAEIVSFVKSLEIVAGPEQMEIIESIKPHRFFNTLAAINKNGVKEYERCLLEKFKGWLTNGTFSAEQMDRFYLLLNGKCEKAFEIINKEYKSITNDWSLSHVYELVKVLQHNNMLPAIFFMNSCEMCDELASKLTRVLEDEEELANAEEFDDRFTFLNSRYKLRNDEIDEEIESHHYRLIPKVFFHGWKRGIGVHHARFHTKFRSSTEYLFRRQHLQIVFATKTLSLGINMPCKTVILGNECWDTMTYRQMIGRAGRRGFDTVGNIVFFGTSKVKVKGFIRSELIKIKGMSYDLETALLLFTTAEANKDNMKGLESVVVNPITRLVTKSEIEKELFRLRLNFLIEKGYLTNTIVPTQRLKLVLPLRHHTCSVFVLNEVIDKKVLHRILDLGDTRDTIKVLKENENKTILVLSHFVEVSYLNPARDVPDNAMLPGIDELNVFLKLYNNQLNDYIEWIRERNSDRSILETMKENLRFYYTSPKNSYLYNFYVNGYVSDIKKENDISETQLWYSLSSFRAIVAAIIFYLEAIDIDNKDYMLKLFNNCAENLKKLFNKMKEMQSKPLVS